MGTNYNPQIVTTGLTLCIDPGNKKSYSFAENLYTFSEQFNQATWGKSAVTYTANNIIAPNNILTGGLLQETSALNTPHWITFGNTLVSNSIYTASCYFKSYSGDRRFFLQINSAGGGGTGYAGMETSNTGNTILNSYAAGDFSNGSFSITPSSNGWVRLAVSWKVSANVNCTTRIGMFNVGAQNYDGNGTSGVYIWGAQLEKDNVANPYIVTTNNPINHSNTCVDLSSIKNNGQLIGDNISYISNKNGTFTFNGANGFVGAFGTDISSLTASRTLSSFFYVDTTNRVSLGGNRDAFGWAVCVNRNAVGSLSYFHASGPGTNDFNVTTANIQQNQWYHACATYDYDFSTVALYLNGQLLGTSSNFGTMIQPTTDTGKIGWEVNSNYFSGGIGATQIYNRALTALEVQQNFNALRGRYGI
jgi:hypothetical protein